MRPVDWLGWKTLGARNRLCDRLWERRLGIATSGRREVDQPDGHRYETFAYLSIRDVLGRLELTADDVVVDVGCGKGRVVCCAALSPARKVVGVDVDGELCAAARRNAERLRGRRAPVQIVNAPAQSFDFSDCTVCVLFNPFGESTMRQVLEALGRSLARRPRPLRLAYVNPVHEGLLDARGDLLLFDVWLKSPWSGLKQDVSFWRSRRPPHA